MFKKNCHLLLIMILILLILSACQQGEKSENQEEKVSPIITEIENYTYDKMEENIQALSKEYPAIKVEIIGRSLAQRKLYLLKLGNGQKKIAVIAGVHGRENITSLLTLKIIEEYANKEKLGKYLLEDIFQEVTFYFLPMLNPDGVEIALKGFSSGPQEESFYLQANEGSSDYRRWKANGRGVDLNKQFQADWEEVKSREKAHFEDYKGSEPESEPESKALADLTRKEEFAAVIAFHHSGSVIYWYYKQSGANYQRDYNLAQKLAKLTGYTLIMPSESNTPAAGYKDWFIKEFNQPGFTIEIGPGKTEKPLPSYQLDKYYQENKFVLLELAKSL